MQPSLSFSQTYYTKEILHTMFKTPDISELSSEAREIITHNIGYRNDDLFDGDDHLLPDALAYEINELENEDILDFTNSQDGNDVINIANAQYGEDTPVYAYWFATLSNVRELYTSHFEDDDPIIVEPITAFELPEKYIVISDLDQDGICIMSPTPKSACKIISTIV